MKKKTIIGKVVYVPIASGCWGIEDAKGRQWRAVEMPEPLQVEGIEVKALVRVKKEDFSIFMWGKAVEIEEYERL